MRYTFYCVQNISIKSGINHATFDDTVTMRSGFFLFLFILLNFAIASRSVTVGNCHCGYSGWWIITINDTGDVWTLPIL